MTLLETVQEHFAHLACKDCDRSLTPEATRMLREERDYCVVSIICTACGQPQGVSLVGIGWVEHHEVTINVERKPA